MFVDYDILGAGCRGCRVHPCSRVVIQSLRENTNGFVCVRLEIELELDEAMRIPRLMLGSM